MGSVELAIKIVAYITAHEPVTYSALEARAKEKGIDPNLFEAAMTALHRFKQIDRRARANGEIVYKRAVIRPKAAAFVQTWVYPQMDETDDGQHAIFAGLDLSYLFMPPDAAKEWWESKKPVWMR